MSLSKRFTTFTTADEFINKIKNEKIALNIYETGDYSPVDAYLPDLFTFYKEYLAGKKLTKDEFYDIIREKEMPGLGSIDLDDFFYHFTEEIPLIGGKRKSKKTRKSRKGRKRTYRRRR